MSFYSGWYTYGIVGIAAVVLVKRQVDRLREMGQVRNGLLEREILQRFRRQARVRRRRAPVAIYVS